MLTPHLRPTVILAAFVVPLVTLGQVRASSSMCPPPATPLIVRGPADVPPATLTLLRCVRADLRAGRWADVDVRLRTARGAQAALAPSERRTWATRIARLAATRTIDAADRTGGTHIEDREPQRAWLRPLVMGLASARAGWATQDRALFDAARADVRALEMLARVAGPVSEAERARLLVQAAIAGAQYEREDMQLLIEGAHALELRFDTGDETWIPVVIANELEADMLLLTDRYAAAAERYRDVLARDPARVQSWIGLAESYHRLGYADQAQTAANQARQLWADADEGARLRLPRR